MGSWPDTPPRLHASFAVQPPPFVSVEVLKAGFIDAPAGSQQVAMGVRATDAAGRVQLLEYALTVEQRDGRWEVSELLPAPTLASHEDD